MSSALEWLKTSFKDLKHEVFKDVEKIKDVIIKPMGDGQVVLISDITRVTLVLETSQGEERTVKAIVKLEALTGPGRDLAAACRAFTTELLMYSDVLKCMEKMMAEVGDRDTLWAECYHSKDNRLLFQDLCEYGYRVVPVQKYLDLEHALLVMKAIGKFHALTMVMKERSILNIDESAVAYSAMKIPFMEIWHLNCLKMLANIMKEKWGPEWSTVPDRMLKYLEKPGDMLHDNWRSTKGKWDVLNHGDFSMRNMLFHYSPGSEHPDNIKFVDFQMCHYSNLGNDLVSLLYSSMKPQVRDENMNSLLQTYVESLSHTAKLFKYKGPVPTVQDVEECLRSLHPYIFITFLVNLPFYIGHRKQDVQKNADKYFENYETCEDIAKSYASEDLMNNLSDEDVQASFKYEILHFVNNKIF